MLTTTGIPFPSSFLPHLSLWLGPELAEEEAIPKGSIE
jgi:hypothetical protein